MLFSLFDNKVGNFGPLFEAHTPQEAQRIFLTAYMSGKDLTLTQYPDDFVLYEVGSFNYETGIFDSYSAPVRVISGFEVAQLSKRVGTFDFDNSSDLSVNEDKSNVETCNASEASSESEVL